MENVLSNNPKVNDAVVVEDSKGNYHLANIKKVNAKSLVVGNRTYYARNSWEGYLVERGSTGWSSKYKLYPATEFYLEKIEASKAREAKEAHQAENKRLQEASDKAEADAYFATPEGKAQIALEEDWVGTTIRVRLDTSYDGRRAKVSIINPVNGHEMFGGEISVYQHLDGWETGNPLKRAEINHGSMQKTVLQQEKYNQALQKAVEIGKLWDLDAGKQWNKEAGVAITPNECAPLDNPE